MASRPRIRFLKDKVFKVRVVGGMGGVRNVRFIAGKEWFVDSTHDTYWEIRWGSFYFPVYFHEAELVVHEEINGK